MQRNWSISRKECYSPVRKRVSEKSHPKSCKVYIRNPNLDPNRALILSRGTIRVRVKSHCGVFGQPREPKIIAFPPKGGYSFTEKQT